MPGLSRHDSTLVRTYTAPSGSLVDLYQSESLKALFDASAWDDAEPGQFIVIYTGQQANGGRVASVILAPGNNP